MTEEIQETRALGELTPEIRDRITMNMAQHALYTLLLITQEEAKGRNSKTIIEALKVFMLKLSKQHELIGAEAQKVFDENKALNSKGSDDGIPEK